MNLRTILSGLAHRTLALMVAMGCLGAGWPLQAAAERCSGNGFSVWCHTYWFGYTKFNLYDQASDLVSEFVNPGDTCQQIA